MWRSSDYPSHLSTPGMLSERCPRGGGAHVAARLGLGSAPYPVWFGSDRVSSKLQLPSWDDLRQLSWEGEDVNDCLPGLAGQLPWCPGPNSDVSPWGCTTTRLGHRGPRSHVLHRGSGTKSVGHRANKRTMGARVCRVRTSGSKSPCVTSRCWDHVPVGLCAIKRSIAGRNFSEWIDRLAPTPTCESSRSGK